MLFPRVLPFCPLGVYCVFEKKANHMTVPFIVMCDVLRIKPDKSTVPTIVITSQNAAIKFPLHNMQTPRVSPLTTTTAVGVKSLPIFASKHISIPSIRLLDALDLDMAPREDLALTNLEHLDLALTQIQVETIPAIREIIERSRIATMRASGIELQGITTVVRKGDDMIVTPPESTSTVRVKGDDASAPLRRILSSMKVSPLEASTAPMAGNEAFDSSIVEYGPVKAHRSRTAVVDGEESSTPLQQLLKSMKASPSMASPPTKAGTEAFHSSVIGYGPVKTHRSRESASTVGTQYRSSQNSRGHTPNSSTSSTTSAKSVFGSSPVQPAANCYPKAFVQSESPFAGIDIAGKAVIPVSSEIASAFTTKASTPQPTGQSGNQVQENASEESKPKSQRKKGRERKAAQAMALKEQRKAVAASSISDAPAKLLVPVGSRSTEGSITGAAQIVDDAAKETQPVPTTKSQRKKGRERKAAQVLKKTEQQTAAVASSSKDHSSADSITQASPALPTMVGAKAESIKQTDQGEKAAGDTKSGKKATPISKSAFIAKTNGTSEDLVPTKAGSQYSLGSVVEPGKPRSGASATFKTKPVGLPTLSVFNPRLTTPPREMNYDVPSREPFPTDYQLRLPEPEVKVPQPASAHQAAAAASQDIVDESWDEVGAANTAIFASTNEGETRTVASSTSPALILSQGSSSSQPKPSVQTPVIASQACWNTNAGPPPAPLVYARYPFSSHISRPNELWQSVDISNPAEWGVSLVVVIMGQGEAYDGPIVRIQRYAHHLPFGFEIVDERAVRCNPDATTSPRVAERHIFEVSKVDISASQSSQNDAEASTVPVYHAPAKGVAGMVIGTERLDQYMNGAVANVLQSFVARQDAHSFLRNGENTRISRLEKVPALISSSLPLDVDQAVVELAQYPDQARFGEALETIAHDYEDTDMDADSVSPSSISEEQSRPEDILTDQGAAPIPEAVICYDTTLYEFSEADTPSDRTMPQNRSDDLAPASTDSAIAAINSTSVPSVPQDFDLSMYELANGVRPRDLTMPQNRATFLEHTVPCKSADQDMSPLSSHGRAITDTVAEARLKDILLRALVDTSRYERHQKSSGATTASLAVSDAVGSVTPATSDSTGAESPAFAKATIAVTEDSSSAAAVDTEGHIPVTNSETTNAAGAHTKHSSLHSEVLKITAKALRRVADALDNLATTPAARTAADTHCHELEDFFRPATIWSGKQGFKAAKVAATIALMPIDVTIKASIVPMKAAKTAYLIGRWVNSRFGPSWLA